jgi:hypothetical protein
MTKQERRRPVHVFDAWEVEFEDLSTPDRPLYRHSYRNRDLDPRLEKATGNPARPARTIKYVRCSSDGRIVGVLMGTSEGLLWVPHVIEEQELRVHPVFLDELSETVAPECRIHGKRKITADEIRTWAKNRNSKDKFV